MRTPPFLMAGALVFWGWQSGFLVAGLLMAAILEASRLTRWRWDLSQADLNHIWDLCSILFIGTAIYFYTSEQLSESAYALVQTLPFVFFLMAAAQMFGARETIELRTFSWLLREKEGEWLLARVNLSWVYFGVCLLSASATARGESWFYFGFAGLTLAALWHARPRRFAAPMGAALLLLVSAGGYIAHKQVHTLQSSLESALGEWLAGIFRGSLDTKESRTSIGELGRLKLSGRIVLRVESDTSSPPDRLREASYNVFRNSIWLASNKDMTPVIPDGADSWLLLPYKEGPRTATVAGYMRHLRGILPLPHGTARISRLPAGGIEQNPMGVVRVSEGPGLLRFNVEYGYGRSIDGNPVPEDLIVPDHDYAAFQRLAEELNLHNLELDAQLRVIRRFFANEFTYSTWITSAHIDPTGKRTPLRMFLEETRSGHCEYFATATALLLRAAGVPARYAVGYAVSESDRQGVTYLVRERHGHSWCLVYRGDGVWEDFDTTPPGWDEIEGRNASAWERFSDLRSALWFQFSKWRWGDSKYRRYLGWALIPLMLLLVWRLLASIRRRHARAGTDDAEQPLMERPGHDSEFYAIETKLAQLGLPRAPHETFRQWMARVEQAIGLPGPPLTSAIDLHYRYRFDPRGLTSNERERLRSVVADLFAALDL